MKFYMEYYLFIGSLIYIYYMHIHFLLSSVRPINNEHNMWIIFVLLPSGRPINNEHDIWIIIFCLLSSGRLINNKHNMWIIIFLSASGRPTNNEHNMWIIIVVFVIRATYQRRTWFSSPQHCRGLKKTVLFGK